jgi:hypothetical protein
MMRAAMIEICLKRVYVYPYESQSYVNARFGVMGEIPYPGDTTKDKRISDYRLADGEISQ